MTLSHIITNITEEFLPALHYKYIYRNFKQSDLYRSYNPAVVPSYLQGRPKPTILHCLHRQASSNKFTNSMVKSTDNGKFEVQGNTKTHMVDFGVVSGEPACTCKDWVKYHIPCKHFVGVFRLFPQWGWEMLPQSYQQSPYLNVDDQAISDYVKDEPQHYSPETSSTPSSPTVSYSPGLDESQQPESDDGKPDEIPCKVNDCIVDVLKL